MIKTIQVIILTYVLLLFIFCQYSYPTDYNIGAYYFPGWTDSPEEWWNPPWEKIKSYPERQPLIGWYPETDLWVAEKHIDMASAYNINFFVYDWYWTGTKPKLDHAINNHLKARNKQKLQFCLLWANHSSVPSNHEQFSTMIDFWIKNYFEDPQYLKIDGKPVIIIFSPQQLRDNAKKFNLDTKALLEIAKSKAIKNGLKGIYFIAAVSANSYWINGYIPVNGYDAMTAYNYHSISFNGEFTGKELSSTTYTELLDGYKSQWSYILDKSSLPYIIPMSAGWDNRPWGSNTPHDKSTSTPETFQKMLLAGKDMMDKFPKKTMRMGIICAWNEFGEGSYIEPTKKWGYQYLQAIKNVFGK
jgi:hypothetical protein